MPFYKQIDLVPYRFPHCRNTSYRLVQIGIGYVQIAFPERVPLHGADAARDRRFCFFRKLLGLPCAGKPAVYIYSYLIVILSAQKPVYRHAQAFAEYIPERCFDRRQRGHQHRAAAPVRVTVDIVPMLFNIARIFTLQVFLYMLQRSQKRLFLIFKSSFSDTVDAAVCINLHEHPVSAEAVDCKRFYVCYFHKYYLLLFKIPILL